MATRKASTEDHGPSEVRLRHSLKKPIEAAQRRLGLRLRQLREERELTQEGAAELAGLHAKHLSVIENAVFVGIGGYFCFGLGSVLGLF